MYGPLGNESGLVIAYIRSQIGDVLHVYGFVVPLCQSCAVVTGVWCGLIRGVGCDMIMVVWCDMIMGVSGFGVMWVCMVVCDVVW